ncbi:MAG: bifunctional 4'-phosphopantothenoylcysteine decarboxylase/phosphopantothenoylcysteine synthetase, partial [Deltaproteobacteria bacterium]|nr:bifunctional 4'-phosphopantothenoylcysteine decarboxylase/phosphopantothenoylcysteine synthetase [Deltaproteobacteria bacterium]
KHDVFIGCAAVADYRPESVAEQKIKKTDDSDCMTVRMVKNPDIIASVAKLTVNRPFTVGFAAETQEVETYARRKLEKKNLDLICANDVSIEGLGFNSDHNALHLFWPGADKILPNASKVDLGHALMEEIGSRLTERT